MNLLMSHRECRILSLICSCVGVVVGSFTYFSMAITDSLAQSQLVPLLFSMWASGAMVLKAKHRVK